MFADDLNRVLAGDCIELMQSLLATVKKAITQDLA